ncbi:MAG: hypothetical protein A2046_08870 [Bacteroidetes bacterium GWA2_30_7]|nr:MAG: hypothetical protein A2046_08870 [Bacteroidetes bacterium GWA2_30_7]
MSKSFQEKTSSNMEEGGNFALDESVQNESSSVSETNEEQSIEGKHKSEETIVIPEKIIKTASVGIEIEDYKTEILKIREIVKANNAYISTEDEKNYSNSIYNNIIIRVKNEDFEKLINLLTVDANKVTYKNINSQDVTEEFVDIAARLKTKKEVEIRYTEILKQAKTIREILDIEEELRQIREEIEAKEGRLKYLNSQVDLSTINLSITQYFITDRYEPGFFGKIGKALSNGWDGLLLFIIGVMYLWPLWLILGIGLVIMFRIIKRKRRKR